MTPVHPISLLAAAHMAQTMCQTNQLQVTMIDMEYGRQITVGFPAQQQIIGLVKKGKLTFLQLTLRSGQQPSIRALEDALEAGHKAPLFADQGLTRYEAFVRADSNQPHLPILLKELGELGDQYQLFARVLQELTQPGELADGQTDYYEMVKSIMGPVSMSANKSVAA